MQVQFLDRSRLLLSMGLRNATQVRSNSVRPTSNLLVTLQGLLSQWLQKVLFMRHWSASPQYCMGLGQFIQGLIETA